MTFEIQLQKLREEIDLILGYSKMATFQCPHCNEYSNTSRFEVMNHIKSDHQPQWVILTLFWVRPKNIWTFCFWLDFWKFIIISFFFRLAFQCQNCSQSFDTEAYLRIHVRQTHSIWWNYKMKIMYQGNSRKKIK